MTKKAINKKAISKKQLLIVFCLLLIIKCKLLFANCLLLFTHCFLLIDNLNLVFFSFYNLSFSSMSARNKLRIDRFDARLQIRVHARYQRGGGGPPENCQRWGLVWIFDGQERGSKGFFVCFFFLFEDGVAQSVEHWTANLATQVRFPLREEPSDPICAFLHVQMESNLAGMSVRNCRHTDK